MEKKQYRQWCSMKPFICSIVPIVVAVGYMGLVAFGFRPEEGCFPGSWMQILLSPCCIVPLIALVMTSMGTYSVVSGIAAVKEPWARGTTLVAVGIVLGILDILIGIGYLFWMFSKVFLKIG